LLREVFGFAPYWELPRSTSWNYGLLSTVAYFGLDVNSDGSFNTSTGGWRGWTSQELSTLVSLAHQSGTRVVVVIKAFDNATINQIVGSPAATQATIANTIAAIGSRGLDGVNVDFEGSVTPQYPNLQQGVTNFMTQLSAQVHQRWPDAQVTVDTYSGSASWDGGLFNIGALAPVVDAFFIMAYDMVFENLPGRAGAHAPLNGWTYNDTTLVSQYLTKAPAGKILLGVPYYGYKWSTVNDQPNANVIGGATAVTYAGVLDDLACARPTRAWDTTAQSPWVAWFSPARGDPCGANRNSWRELYYEDATSLGYKYDLVNTRGLLGTGMWALGYDAGSQDLWPVLATKFGQVWSASFDLSALPCAWAANEAQTFSVTVTNTGNQAWPASGPNPVHLGLHFARAPGGWPAQLATAYTLWATDQRFALPGDVAPGGTATLSVTARAPAASGAMVLEAEMVKEQQFWFMQWAPVSVSVAAPRWAAGYNLSGVPREWAANQTQAFSLTVTNTGNQTWPASGVNPVHLGLHFSRAGGGWPLQVASYYSAWLTDQRFALPNDLAPGATSTLSIIATAPSAFGPMVLEAEMVKEQKFWFEQWASTAVHVARPAWYAAFDLTGVPRSWIPGQSQSVAVTVTNTGNQTWPAGGSNPVHLGLHVTRTPGGWPSQVASWHTAWLTDQRVPLPADVAPGETITISAGVTVPPGTGGIALEVEMVKEQQFWFDQWSALALTSAPAAWFATVDLGAAPRQWRPGQTQAFAITVTNTGNQEWPAGGPNPVHLGVHFTVDAGGWPAEVRSAHTAWLTDQRIALPADVPPGTSVTVTVSASAPGARVAALEAEMVKEQQFWFNQWVPVAVTNAG
jgi:GH18 family chitinase